MKQTKQAMQGDEQPVWCLVCPLVCTFLLMRN